MRRILLLTLLLVSPLVLVNVALATVPVMFSLQGQLTNLAGTPIAGTQTVEFRIWGDSIGGLLYYTESKSVTTNANGQFSTVIGSSGSLDMNVFDDESLFLVITVGADPEMTPRSRLVSVPWAIGVQSVDGAFGGTLLSPLWVPILFVTYTANIVNPSGGVATDSRSLYSTTAQNYGFLGRADNSTNLNVGVYGEAHDANGSSNSAGIYGRGISDFGGAIWAGYFDGWAHVPGGFSAGSKAFKIDDPTDPTNSTLMHSCVESDEHKNVYDGVVTTNADGNATVSLPSWFSALNSDFRYQLTAIGQFAQVIVSNEITNNQFSIASDKPNVKVSWQVTGVRKDPYALAHPVEVQKAKPAELRGKYLHPKEYGVSEELGVNHTTYQEMEARREAQAKEREASRHPETQK